jgi:hypothetical protein
MHRRDENCKQNFSEITYAIIRSAGKISYYIDRASCHKLSNKQLMHTVDTYTACIINPYIHFDKLTTTPEGHAVAQLVEALRYKPKGCGFDSRWCQWNF